MRVMAQMGMVMNLDKCIGCHTCSVTCKQAWTNRAGTEYVWFNNVETRPGQGYPRRLRGPGEVAGRLELNQPRPAAAQGRRPAASKLLGIFATPVQPELADYYEPWTYDYQTLIDAPLGDDFPVARPKSLITGEDTKITWSANWDDDLGGATEIGPPRPDRGARSGRSPRTRSSSSSSRPSCSTCRGSASTASTRPAWPPARPARSTSAPRTASCWSTRTAAAAGGSASPAARTRRSTSTTSPARPRSARSATRGSRSACRRCARRPASAGCATSGCSCTTPTRSPRPPSVAGREGPLPGAAGPAARPERPGGASPRPAQQGIPEDWLDAARRSPVYALAKKYRVALPLHPEYRTMPMVWYVPPLSPVVDLLARPGPRRGGPPASCSAPSRRCGSRWSTWPSCSPPATPTIVDGVLQQARRDARLHARHHPRPRAGRRAIPAVGRDDRARRCTRCTG